MGLDLPLLSSSASSSLARLSRAHDPSDDSEDISGDEGLDDSEEEGDVAEIKAARVEGKPENKRNSVSPHQVRFYEEVCHA